MRAVLSLLVAAFLPTVAFAAEPTLTIKAGDKQAAFTRAALLKRPELTTLTIADDPAYPGKTMTYKAVPAYVLFEGLDLAANAVIQFKCLDGFSAPIGRDRLLNKAPDKSIAYVAIETTDAPWPALKPGAPTAGPFYLVWPKPELSFIGREEWPYQLAAFEVKGSLAQVYPAIFPDPKLKADSPVVKGFEVFTRNCFACHTLNKSGAAEFGPDLNVPMSPTEYFTKGALKKLIRDPQSLRHFPKSRMVGFPPSVISDKDLDDLIAYLEHMAKRRQ